MLIRLTKINNTKAIVYDTDTLEVAFEFDDSLNYKEDMLSDMLEEITIRIQQEEYFIDDVINNSKSFVCANCDHEQKKEIIHKDWLGDRFAVCERCNSMTYI